MNEVDTYLEKFDGDVRKRLGVIREIIRTEAPDSVEGISYGLVGYKRNGKPLVYFGGFVHHIGFYATPNGHEAFKVEFSEYVQGKGSVQFQHDEPLPKNLIKRVVKYRCTQTEK